MNPYRPSQADQRYELVTEFHDTFSVIAPRLWDDVSNATALARRTLHDEEFKEYMAAEDDIDILDALVDMEYIAAGSQQLLALKRPAFDKPGQSLLFYQQRLMDELNKSQLCQNGLTNNMALFRAKLEQVADDAGYRFHDAFIAVHESNMRKLWKKEQLEQMLEGSTATLVSLGMYAVKRADGKILKPPGWTPPALARYV